MGIRIGMRELLERLGEYLDATMPIAVTRYGQTVGFFIPVPKTPGRAERDAFLSAGLRMQEECVRLGITEEELAADFKKWRAARRGK